MLSLFSSTNYQMRVSHLIDVSWRVNLKSTAFCGYIIIIIILLLIIIIMIVISFSGFIII